ncbi:MAG: biopolymer transporter ExbD [Sneathiella sp.]|uniref:ExbD/TolR family protein n=1 Tax=Sneathiella sp. TaxID=1964365 RepID=UPI000C67288D|nr:biopolymer transporter ExbD [Sneathiella sp.]MAZ03634.1 biopolymer transporter ExbD [Sneathiella sp.]
MRLHVTPCRKSIIGLTSLIDVIFLLLLFFMLTSTFLRYTGFDLSVAAASGDAPASETILLVHLNADGTLSLNGEPVAGPDLTIEITEFHARGIEHAVLRPRGEVPVQLLVDTLEMLQSTELTSVSLAR